MVIYSFTIVLFHEGVADLILRHSFAGLTSLGLKAMLWSAQCHSYLRQVFTPERQGAYLTLSYVSVIL